jgi:uncharacterized protein (DUF1800 family)
LRPLGWFVGLLLLAAAAPCSAAPASDRDVVHILNRLAFGPNREDFQYVKTVGIEHYIAEQLHPETIPEPFELRWDLAQFDTLELDAAQLRRLYGPPQPVFGIKPSAKEIRERREQARAILQQAGEARLLRAILSRRQLQEVMVDFWFNHFNVFADKGLAYLWVGDYENRAIRPYALGRFRDLLFATAKHPAMLVYLDNTLSSAPGRPGAGRGKRGLNENFAREIMELHTLGVNGGYTEEDVATLARVFTGWSVNRADGGDFPADAAVFDGARHDFGAKVFLGRPLSARGKAEGEEALDILASSPATARHIAYELAQYFVADDPPGGLVRRLAARFTETGGDIREMLRVLFASPEFRAALGQKYKTPYQYVVAAVRASGLPVRNVQPLLNALNGLGMPLYECPTPDGYGNTEAAWLSPDGTTRRIAFAAALARGGLPLSAASPSGLLDLVAATGQRRVEPAAIERLYGAILTARTRAAVAAAAPGLRAMLLLGSPELMYR